MRRAYLELLKLCLCDLAAPQTTSLEGVPGGGVVSRELAGEELELRVRGRDWPLHGMTMIGLLRLDDLQRCVEEVVEQGIEGDLIEVGTWRGGASILMRSTLDALGAMGRTVWLADSFAGFPAPSEARAAASAYRDTLEPYLAAFDFLAVPLAEVKAGFARFGCDRGVEFTEGFFEHTLPPLKGRRWSLVRLDADTYDSTMLALNCLYPGLVAGGHLIVDDYGAVEECRAAVDRFRSEHAVRSPLQRVDSDCVRWQKGPGEATEPEGGAPPSRPPGAKAMPRRHLRQPPSARELELAAECDALRQQLTAARSELERARRFESLALQMSTSASWRLTRPLRELGRYVRARQR